MRTGGEVEMSNGKRIEYTSEDGYRGLLYNWHFDDWTGEWNYSMSIYDKTGFEVLHSYNASPKNKEELKRVVECHGSMRFILEDLAKRM